MNNFTSADYIVAVRKAIDDAKSGPDAGRWLNASPAQLRNWCQQVYWQLDHEMDRNPFKEFFNLPVEVDKVDTAFQQFSIGRMKAVGNFIAGSSEKPNWVIVELLAVLVGFENRPYSNFRKGIREKTDLKNSDDVMRNEELKGVDGSNDKEKAVVVKREGTRVNTVVSRSRSMSVNKFSLWITLCVFIVLIGGLMIYNFRDTNSGCMFWDKDHFKVIDCDSQTLGFAAYRKLIPVQEHLLRHFQKLEVDPETIFFQNGKAIIWYGKNLQGEYEYFSYSGEHPETGKYLRPITTYHINKYIVGKERRE